MRLSNLDKQGPTEGLGWKAKLRGSSSLGLHHSSRAASSLRRNGGWEGAQWWTALLL